LHTHGYGWAAEILKRDVLEISPEEDSGDKDDGQKQNDFRGLDIGFI
jgi:hypothetical protein